MPYNRMTKDNSCNEVEIFGMPFQGVGISGPGTEGVALGYYGSALWAGACLRRPSLQPSLSGGLLIATLNRS
jgi:hypothetical protein